MKPIPSTFLAACLLGAASFSGLSDAAVLIDSLTLNGGFEAPDLTGNSSKNGFDTAGKDLVNWANTGTSYLGGAGTYGDVGVDNNSGGAHSGNQFAFFHGGEGGAYNLTSYAIQAGDQFTLSWWGRADTIAIRLFSSTDGTYGTAATLGEITQLQSSGTYTQYSFNYNAVPGDVGKTIGVSIFNPVVGYANVDDVSLAVVPEASSSMALAVSGAAILLRRSRRRKI